MVQAHNAVIADRGGIAAHTLIYRRAKPARRPVRLAPRPAYVVGREELIASMRSLFGTASEMQIVALSGLGGVGKTTLALEYGHRYLVEYDLVWQLSVDNDTTASAGLAELARQLDAYDPLDPGADVVQLVHGALADRPGRWLLIMDNAPDFAAVRHLLPPSGRGNVLITSQHHNWPETWRLYVGVLDQRHAVEFLLSRSGDSDTAAAMAIARELGELPLALEQVGAYSRATGLSLANYRTALHDHLDQLLLRGRQPADKTVVATLSLPLEQLERVTPSAVALLRLMAFCAPDAIPVQILLGDKARLFAAMPQALAMNASPLLGPMVTVLDAINDLRRFSLCIPNTSNETISIHRLVQVVVIERLTAEERQHWRALVCWLIETALPSNPEDSKNWPIFATLLPHALKVLPADTKGIQNLGDYLYASSDYTNAYNVRSRILNEIHGKHGDNHGDTIKAMDGLAEVLQSQGNYAAARPLFDAALLARRQALGENHPDTAKSMNHVAEVLREQGDYQAARNLHQQALEIRRRTLGVKHLDTVISMRNLAIVLQELGDYPASLRLLEHVLQIRRQLLGDSHPDVADAMNALGLLLLDLGRYQDARNMYEEALVIYRRVHGNDHLDIAGTLNNLGVLMWTIENHPAARPLLEQSLDIHRRMLGDDHPLTATSMNNFAALLVNEGDYSAARRLLEQSLPIRRRVLGDDHPDIATTINNLAAVFLKEGDRPAARQLLEDTLQRQRRALGENHARTADAMNNLAAVLIEQGDVAAARDLLKQSLAIRRRVLGDNHPDAVAASEYLRSPIFKRSMLERLRSTYNRGR